MTKCCGDYNAGMLREPVTFQRAAKASDGAGGYTETWGAIAGAPTLAHAKYLSGNERWASQRVEATAKIRIAVRWFDGLLASDAVVIRSRRCNIRFINNVEFADKWLEIELGEGVAA